MAAGAYDSASDIMQGQMLIYVDNALFAFSTSTELALNTNMVDTSNQLDGGWESSLPGKKGWTLNGQSFGQTVTVWFGKCTITDNAEGGVDVVKEAGGWTGKAHITGCTVTSEAGNLVKFQCNMQGTGALKSAGEQTVV